MAKRRIYGDWAGSPEGVPLNEPVLDDDYPMYGDYWYIVDGKPTRSDYHGVTVADYRRRTGAKEIRRCDIVGRMAATERGERDV